MFQKWVRYSSQNSDKIFITLGQIGLFVAAIAAIIYSILQVSTWRGFQFDPFLTIGLIYIVFQQNMVLKSIQHQNQKNMEIMNKLVEKQNMPEKAIVQKPKKK